MGNKGKWAWTQINASVDGSFNLKGNPNPWAPVGLSTAGAAPAGSGFLGSLSFISTVSVFFPQWATPPHRPVHLLLAFREIIFPGYPNISCPHYVKLKIILPKYCPMQSLSLPMLSFLCHLSPPNIVCRVHFWACTAVFTQCWLHESCVSIIPSVAIPSGPGTAPGRRLWFTCVEGMINRIIVVYPSWSYFLKLLVYRTITAKSFIRKVNVLAIIV